MELLEDSGGGKKPLTDWHGVMSDLFGVGQYFSFFVFCFKFSVEFYQVLSVEYRSGFCCRKHALCRHVGLDCISIIPPSPCCYFHTLWPRQY